MDEPTLMTKNHFLEKVLFWVLLLVSALSPIFFLPFSFVSTQFSTSLLFAFAVILATIIYVISSLISGSLDLPRPTKYVIGFTATVPIVYFFAGIANGFSRMSFFGYTFDQSTVGFIALAFIYLFLVSILFRNKNRIFYSYFAFVISSIILAAYLLLRIILGAKFLSFGMFSDITMTPVGSFNNVGIFFGIGAILSLLSCQMLNLSKLVKALVSVALVLSLFFLAIVNFKIVWIILSICALLYIIYSLVSQRNSGTLSMKKIPIYPLASLIIGIIFIIWGAGIGSILSNKLNISNLEVRPSLSVTLDIAKNTIKQRPLFGSGPNTFVTQWLFWKPDDVISTIFWNTDFTNGIGLIPTFAVTTGLVGVLSWLVFLSFYLYLGIKSIFAKIEDSFNKFLLVSSFLVSLYLWIMAFAYVSSTVIFILTFFFTGLFFASVYITGIIPVGRKVFSDNPKNGFMLSLFLVAVLLASLALAYGLYKNSESLWYFQKASYALNNTGDVSLAETNMTKAIRALPYDVYYRALSEIELARLNIIVSQNVQDVKPEVIQSQFKNTLSNAIKAGISAKDADPTNYINWISLGRVYEAVSPPQLQIQGAYESAQFAYGEALRRNPKNPSILAVFARLALAHNDLKQARAYAEQAIAVKQNYIDAYFLLSQIEVADNNIKGAIDAVSASSVINPTDPGIFFQLGLLKYNIKDYFGAIDALEKATKLTPDYANAKYFLGLSYEATGDHSRAIEQFSSLKLTNPDNKEVNTILLNLRAGKPIFTNTTNPKPEKGKKLPVKETQP